jgi:heterodisulfide reductase subunit D
MAKTCSCGIDLDKLKLKVEFGDVKSIMRNTNTFYCMECGKCTSTCPVALVNPEFSPRKIVSRVMAGQGISLLTNQLIWTCLTCGLCYDHCPSDVRFIDFIREMRNLAGIQGTQVPCAHGGTMQSLMRLMTSTDMNQNRLDWLTDDLKTSETGEYMLFVGCTPYYDAYFDELKLESTNIAKSAIRLLNKLDIVPAVSKNERCCGHDIYWSGDYDMFRMLIERNMEIIKQTGAKKIITTCAECFRTLKFNYREYVDFPFEVQHFSEFLAERIFSAELQFKGEDIKATYHDPCRLSRHSKVVDAPRSVLKALPGVELHEMKDSAHRSRCCGTSSWMHCDINSKMIQVSRLREAKETKAELLVTACPKCMIHFKCAQNDPKIAEDIKIEIKDLAELVSEQVK